MDYLCQTLMGALGPSGRGAVQWPARHSNRRFVIELRLLFFGI